MVLFSSWFLISCAKDSPKVKLKPFSSETWKNGTSTDRNLMIEDLYQKTILKRGMSYTEVINKLGFPDFGPTDKLSLLYNISDTTRKTQFFEGLKIDIDSSSHTLIRFETYDN